MTRFRKRGLKSAGTLRTTVKRSEGQSLHNPLDGFTWTDRNVSGHRQAWFNTKLNSIQCTGFLNLLYSYLRSYDIEFKVPFARVGCRYWELICKLLTPDIANNWFSVDKKWNSSMKLSTFSESAVSSLFRWSLKSKRNDAYPPHSPPITHRTPSPHHLPLHPSSNNNAHKKSFLIHFTWIVFVYSISRIIGHCRKCEMKEGVGAGGGTVGMGWWWWRRRR